MSEGKLGAGSALILRSLAGGDLTGGLHHQLCQSFQHPGSGRQKGWLLAPVPSSRSDLGDLLQVSMCLNCLVSGYPTPSLCLHSELKRASAQ